MGLPIFTVVAFGGTGNFPSSITLHCNVNLFHCYLAPYGVDTAFNLGVFLPIVTIG